MATSDARTPDEYVESLPADRRATVEAEWDEDNETYRIRINRCSGEVTSIRQIS